MLWFLESSSLGQTAEPASRELRNPDPVKHGSRTRPPTSPLPPPIPIRLQYDFNTIAIRFQYDFNTTSIRVQYDVDTI